MKKFLVILHVIAVSLCAPSGKEAGETVQKSSKTTYDQRQVGKYNIHFNIKDVAIIALSSEDLVDHIGDSDSYADYYDYEDDEFTVNPIIADLGARPSTTAKPNVTHHQSLMPTIAGLNLSSIPTSTEQSSAVSVPQTLVVIHEKPSTSNETYKNVESASVSYQHDEIPVQVIVEPLLKPKVPRTQQPAAAMKRKLSNRQVSQDDDANEFEVRPRRRRGQMIERIRSRRAQNRLTRNSRNGCGQGKSVDNGCRIRRSGMGGFFDMLKRFLPQRDNE